VYTVQAIRSHSVLANACSMASHLYPSSDLGIPTPTLILTLTVTQLALTNSKTRTHQEMR